MSQDLQFVGRQVAVQSRYPVAHREDENLEPSRSKATRHGGYGSRGVEPTRTEGVGDTGWHVAIP